MREPSKLGDLVKCPLSKSGSGRGSFATLLAACGDPGTQIQSWKEDTGCSGGGGGNGLRPFLGCLPFPFFPGILLSKKPPNPLGKQLLLFLKRERWLKGMEKESTPRPLAHWAIKPGGGGKDRGLPPEAHHPPEHTSRFVEVFPDAWRGVLGSVAEGLCDRISASFETSDETYHEGQVFGFRWCPTPHGDHTPSICQLPTVSCFFRGHMGLHPGLNGMIGVGSWNQDSGLRPDPWKVEGGIHVLLPSNSRMLLTTRKPLHPTETWSVQPLRTHYVKGIRPDSLWEYLPRTPNKNHFKSSSSCCRGFWLDRVYKDLESP